MANVLVEETSLQDIADAIRTKNGSQNTYKPGQMAGAIEAIPTGSTPTGTKQISITENGRTTEDVSAYANAEITVNVSGSSGYDVDDIAQRNYAGAINIENASIIKEYAFAGSGITSITSSSVTLGNQYMCNGCSNLVSVNLPNIVQNGSGQATGWFSGCTSLRTIILPKVTLMWNYFYQGCTSLITVVMPALNNSRQNNFNACSALKTVDFGANFSSIAANFWDQSPLLDTVILRRTAGVASLANVNGFSTSGAFSESGSGGTIYVPSALISSYESAANWSTILGYANNKILAIEGSVYENQYADGTAI